MMPTMSPLKVRAATLVLMCAAGFLLAGCDDRGGDPTAEIGPHPNLPALQQFLFPPMHLASIVGWNKGETPTVPQGMKIQAFATGLDHPRWLLRACRTATSWWPRRIAAGRADRRPGVKGWVMKGMRRAGAANGPVPTASLCCATVTATA